MKFRVGDVCEVLNPRPATNNYVGRIVTIAGHAWTQSDGTGFYTVKELSPHWFAHDELRLLPPPTYPDQFTAGDWDLIPFRPKKLVSS